MPRSTAIDQLEEAVHLLRSTGFASLVIHWSGSVPFALAFLVCWNAFTSSPLTDTQCAAGALVLALLLVWMNCRRAVFAGLLRNRLSGTSDTPWTSARRWRLAAGQSFLAATKPVALVISLLVIFPFARTVAIYRFANALTGRDDVDTLPALRQARLLSAHDSRQTWTLLPLLFFVFLLVWANLALTLAMLPQLIRIFTGYESSFTRSGIFFVENPLFFLLATVLAWLAFDPFMQAVYCTRCFHAESRQTGEDIRAGLRALIKPASIAALLLLAIPAARSQAISPNDLEQSVRHTMEAPAYAWRIPAPVVRASKMPWIVSITDHLLTSVKNGLKTLGHLLVKIVEWIFDHLGVSPDSQGGAAPALGLHWSLYILIAVIVAALAFVIWRRRIFSRRRAKAAATADVPLIRLDDEALTADRLPEESWLELAEQCLREENFLHALRAFFLANLAWLGRIEYIAIHPGKTNHEYEIELRRRTRSLPDARDLFAANIAAFERAWYGRHHVAREQVEEFRQRVLAMKRAVAPAPQALALQPEAAV